LIEAKNDSERALSQHRPVRPWDSFTAQPLARPANSAEVYCASSTGRCNTGLLERA